MAEYVDGLEYGEEVDVYIKKIILKVGISVVWAEKKKNVERNVKN